MAENTIIPSLKVTGRFEALAPFDRVINPMASYTVEAMRTVGEMQGLGVNIFQQVFAPVAVDQATYLTMIDQIVNAGGVIISLIPRKGVPIYVPSTYLKSFPLVDGFLYERMVLVADLGALSSDMKPALDEAMTHFQDWIKMHYGITSTVKLGTVPVIGYVSQFEHETMETARKNRITDNTSDLAKNVALEKQVADLQAYVKDLELRLGAVP
jgi:hypothetical protein